MTLPSVVLIAAGVALIGSCVEGPPQDVLVAQEVRDASRQARDGDLQADWNKLLDARARLERLVGDKDVSALVHYHLGYVDWRLASLVYMSTGMSGQAPYLRRAVSELEQAVALQPDFADAYALIGMLTGALIGTDPSQAEQLRPRLQAAWKAALQPEHPGPRVMLLRAMAVFASPPQYGGSREKGLALWQDAIALFGKERTRDIPGPEWGHAEAWGWLGGAYLMNNEPDKAVPAFERALQLRKDFWWVASVALPQARRPALVTKTPGPLASVQSRVTNAVRGA
jgi:tetratricopeptide (TPR) repeat protein